MNEHQEALEALYESIKARAYAHYVARREDHEAGDAHGHDIEDWLKAEAELRAHPITTASEAAEIGGAEAAAAEEKREAEAAAQA